jgi:hypothetical protein
MPLPSEYTTPFHHYHEYTFSRGQSSATKERKYIYIYKQPQRQPITPQVLFTLKSFLSASNYSPSDQIMLWAAFLTAFFGFLHASEFLLQQLQHSTKEALLITDIVINNNHAQLQIKTFKTDPFHHGCTIRLAQTHPSLCPTSALKQLVQIHPTNTGPLFISKIARSIFSKHYNIHNSYIQLFVPKWLIQQHGRWNSDGFRTYTQVSDSTIEHVVTALNNPLNIQQNWDPDLC